MANIRIDVPHTIRDGMAIVFRSPVDCSAITGLIAYYPGEDGNTTSKEFVLADAHGENVGDIDHLFAANVVVKVILDVTDGMAYVQNADTNAYIESTFIKTVNGKAPDENGNVEVAGGGSITVDSELSETSENPVQNKAIVAVLAELIQQFSGSIGELSNAIPTDAHINSLIDAYIGEALGGEY